MHNEQFSTISFANFPPGKPFICRVWWEDAGKVPRVPSLGAIFRTKQDPELRPQCRVGGRVVEKMHFSLAHSFAGELLLPESRPTSLESNTKMRLGIALRETGFPVFPFSRRISSSRSRTRNFVFPVRETGNLYVIN